MSDVLKGASGRTYHVFDVRIDATCRGGMGRAESSPLTAKLKQFFVASYLHFCDIVMFCLFAFVAFWYLHT